MSQVDLGISFCGVRFLNPFLLAASPSTDSRELIARGFEAGWSGAVMKTTSVAAEEVSIAYPIMSGLKSRGFLVGMHNIDIISERHIDAFARDIVWLKRRFPQHRISVSIVGSTRAEWQLLVQKCEQAGADLVELGISCPQGAELADERAEGSMISQDARLTEKVTGWAREASQSIPIYVKIGPNVTDIRAIARAIQRGGGQGICAIDSPEAIGGVDLTSFSPLPSVHGFGSRGGLTGRAIKPIAMRCVADIAEAVRIPISGVGGIYDWRDALQFLMLGATTLQVCTAVMQHGFPIINDLCDGLSRWLLDHGYAHTEDVIGMGLPNLKDHPDLPHGIPVFANIDQEVCIGCGLCYVSCRDAGHVAIEFLPGRRLRVDKKKCVGCGLCAQVCPVPGCIEIG